nr:hypothetical protein Itr_chr15CG15860 [Ipomoea trifida]
MYGFPSYPVGQSVPVTSEVRYRGAVGQLNGRIIRGAEIKGEGSFATVVSVASGVDVSAANGGAAGEDGGVLSE